MPILVLLSAAVAAGLTVALLASLAGGAVPGVDASLARWSHEHVTGAAHDVADVATRMGATWFAVVAVAAVATYAWRRGGSPLVLPFLVVVVGGAKLITTGLKDVVDRARPALDPVTATMDPSFPSGHSSTAAALFAGIALVLCVGRPRRARVAIAATGVGLAVAVAATRVLLTVHWLTDVVAGLALGWAWFAVCAAAFGPRLLRSDASASPAPAPLATRPPGG